MAHEVLRGETQRVSHSDGWSQGGELELEEMG